MSKKYVALYLMPSFQMKYQYKRFILSISEAVTIGALRVKYCLKPLLQLLLSTYQVIPDILWWSCLMVTQYFERTGFDLFQACDWLLRVDWLTLVHA